MRTSRSNDLKSLLFYHRPRCNWRKEGATKKKKEEESKSRNDKRHCIFHCRFLRLPFNYPILKMVYLFHHGNRIKVNRKIAPQRFGSARWVKWARASDLVLKTVIKLLLAIVLKFGLKNRRWRRPRRRQKSFMLYVQLPNQVAEEELHRDATRCHTVGIRTILIKILWKPNSTTSNQFRMAP